MVFQNPGLEALHQYITGNQKPASPIEQTMVAQAETNAQIEEINREVQEEPRLERPTWKGFGY